VDAFVQFPVGTPNIIQGFQRMGYRTFGCAALEWFNHPNLASPFQRFLVTGTHLARQVEFLKSEMFSSDAPFFAFANVGETHEPYEFGGLIEPALESRARMRRFEQAGFLHEEHRKQVACLEYIDAGLGGLLADLEKEGRRLLVVVCGDHGECFGEDGFYGHGFYHPKVMEVPLGIFYQGR
jgi:membrane-anchored protein YejM (alkaline phosphatase superfamily)